MMCQRNEDAGILTEDMAVRILSKVGTLPLLDPVERVHVFSALLDRCEQTGGRVTPG